jgi:purine nucleoside permease
MISATQIFPPYNDANQLQFKNEMETWHSASDGLNLMSRAIRIPGLSEKYPVVYCAADGDVCQVTTGMGCK